MRLFILIMEDDYKKLITCIKEQYDLIIDQIRTFSHALYKVCQSWPVSHCLAHLTSFSSRKTIISASSLNILQVLQWWMFCQSVQRLLKKNPKPTTIYLQNSSGHNISMSDPTVQLEAFKLPQPQS